MLRLVRFTQTYWNSNNSPVVPVLGTAVAAVVVLPLPLLVVELSSSPPHAAKISKKIPIRTGIVNFCNFLSQSPHMENWPLNHRRFSNRRDTSPLPLRHVQSLSCPNRCLCLPATGGLSGRPWPSRWESRYENVGYECSWCQLFERISYLNVSNKGRLIFTRLPNWANPTAEDQRGSI